MDIDRIKSQIARYQQRVETTPEREQALLTLQRDYQNMQASYSSLLNRKLEADISVNMERKQKGEQFRILDRARLPVRPVEPDLLRLFLITIIAGLGLGGGIVFLMEYLNTCFRSPKEVELALGLPTIAIVPFLENRKTRFLKTLNSVGTSVALVFASLMLAFFAALALHGVEETLALVSNVMHIML
jgi:capsular polysaccharide biosynthesis protein